PLSPLSLHDALPIFSGAERPADIGACDSHALVKTIASKASHPTIAGIEITIRQARPEDADTIAQFNSSMARETEQRNLDPSRVLAGVKALLNDPAKGIYFIVEAQQNGEPVIAGQLLITYEWSDWRNGQFWWIQSVYVAEPFRSQGVFRSLFHHVHALAKKRKDVCGVRLY